MRVTRLGAVRLETEDGIPVINFWNIEHLRKFYPQGAVAGSPDNPHFVLALPIRHVTLCTGPGADPVHNRGKESLSMYSFLSISMFMYIRICMLVQGTVLLFDSSKC